MIVASEATAWSVERQASMSPKSQDEHEKQQRENKYRMILNLQRFETHTYYFIFKFKLEC